MSDLVASWADISEPLVLPEGLITPQPRSPTPTPTPTPTAAVAATHPPPPAVSCGARVALLLSLLWSTLLVALQALHHGGVGIFQAHRPRRLYHNLFVDQHSRRCVRQCVLLDVFLFRGACPCLSMSMHVHVLLFSLLFHDSLLLYSALLY